MLLACCVVVVLDTLLLVHCSKIKKRGKGCSCLIIQGFFIHIHGLRQSITFQYYYYAHNLSFRYNRRWVLLHIPRIYTLQRNLACANRKEEEILCTKSTFLRQQNMEKSYGIWVLLTLLCSIIFGVWCIVEIGKVNGDHCNTVLNLIRFTE